MKMLKALVKQEEKYQSWIPNLLYSMLQESLNFANSILIKTSSSSIKTGIESFLLDSVHV